MSPAARRGRELLHARIARMPDLVRAAAEAPEPDLAVDPVRVRRWWTTGIGSSAANARLLASVLSEELALPARFVAAATAARPDAGGPDDALVVFSQGLSPNACHALAHPERFGRVILVTAVDPGRSSADRVARLEAARAGGVRVLPLPSELGEEDGALARVAGPGVGHVVALALARALARRLGRTLSGCDVPMDRLCARLAAADRAVEAAFPTSTPLPFSPERPLVLLASGGYGERATHLATKVLEGMLLPAPPLWDLLDFAHGPFQQLHDRPALLVLLARADAPQEPALLERLRAMLQPHHDLRVLRAELPGPLAALDHEAQWNALLLRWQDERGVDPADWPGRERDAPLYELAPEPRAGDRGRPAPHARTTAEPASLETLTWPELGAALAAGRTTAVLPLGSTEQHGPHLPFATDTWVAEALAARFAARVPEAVCLPVLALGCASEHMAFPGTLSLEPATLEAVVADLLVSLRRHGFERAFVFSAHGGNVSLLRRSLARWRALAAPLAVTAFADHAAVASACADAAAGFGVAPEVAGHHAGELETSIVAALRAGAVRRDRLAPGHVRACDDPQSLFHPDLRAHAPSGVVGDPRGADARRAETYLAAWVEVLVAAYGAEKKRHHTKGTVRP